MNSHLVNLYIYYVKQMSEWKTMTQTFHLKNGFKGAQTIQIVHDSDTQNQPSVCICLKKLIKHTDLGLIEQGRLTDSRQATYYTVQLPQAHVKKQSKDHENKNRGEGRIPEEKKYQTTALSKYSQKVPTPLESVYATGSKSFEEVFKAECIPSCITLDINHETFCLDLVRCCGKLSSTLF